MQLLFFDGKWVLYACTKMACIVLVESRCVDEEQELKEEIICTEEQKSVQACTLEYAPVCGKSVLNTGEIAYETYGNKCAACASMKVVSYSQGEC